jgi:uncharacterized protein YbaP (TraB family)
MRTQHSSFYLLQVALLWLVFGTGAWAKPPHPLLWKVSDSNSSVYLLGSFHLLKTSDYPLAPAVDAAFVDSAKVCFEIPAQGENAIEIAQAMQIAAVRKDGKTLLQALAPKISNQLQSYARAKNLPVESLQGYKPWFVAVLLLMLESQAMGLDPELGLDHHFMNRATAAGKATCALESAEAQIALFYGLSNQQQEQLLEETLGEVRDFQQQMQELHTAWRNGDEAALSRLGLQEMRTDYPELFERINTARNKTWLPKLEALLAESDEKNVLVVVGALHLLGNDGLIALLRSRGYRVERLP